MASNVTSEPVEQAKVPHLSWNPFRVGGTELPPAVLLMAKILAICFLLTQHWRALPDHFLPFLPIFDHAGSPAGFKHTLQVVFMLAAFCLLFNYRVRTSCLVLGGVMFVGILSSRTFFENNRTYTACLWLLAGLQVPGMKPWPLRAQVILLYFGAGLNKLLDVDWRTGQFFENMVVNLGRQQLYIKISSWLPHLWLSIAMGWTVILVEFIVAFGFLIRRFCGPIAWIGIAYHTTLLLVARNTFGMFYFATLSSFLVFVTWPLPWLSLSFVGNNSDRRKVLGFLKRFDLDDLFVLGAGSETDTVCGGTEARVWAGLRLNVGGRLYSGLPALYMSLIYNPLTYFVFAIILSLPLPIDSPFRAAWAVIFLLFMSPALLSPVVQSFAPESK